MSNVLKYGSIIKLVSLTSDPGTAEDGSMYYNSTAGVVRQYTSGSWVDVSNGTLVGQTLTNAHVLIGDPSNLSASVDTSAVGDISADSTTGLNIKSGVIVNSDINASAAIAVSKLAALTASKMAITDGSGILTTASYAATEPVLRDGSVALTGNLDAGSHKLTNLAAPTTSSDAATKSYVDTVAEGLKPKAAVRVASTANINLASALVNGATVDGVTVATGDRVLVKDQSTASLNGIYIVAASGAASRSSDFDSLSPIDEINGAYVPVQEGTANAGKFFVQSGLVSTLGSDPILFVFFNSAATLSAGNGIDITSNVISVKLDGSTLATSGSGIKVASAGITTTELSTITDGVTLDQSGSGSTLEVKAGGISNTQVNASAAIARSKLASGTANRVAVNDGSGVLSDAAAITASRALISDTNGIPTHSATTSTELGYVSGVTSAIQTQLNAKAGHVVPSTNQMVYVNSGSGNDTTGDGSYDKPFATVQKAMTSITDASSTKPYVVALQAARQVETGDVFIKPYTFIVGMMQRATYFRVNSGQIKPDTSHGSVASWTGFKNLYIGGSSTINWDLQALGGSNCVMVIENCTVSGPITYKGRNSGGGDYLEWYGESLAIGAVTLDSVLCQLQGIEFGSTVTFTNTQANVGLSSSMDNCVFDAALSITSVATMYMNNIAYTSSSSLTTSGTVGIQSFRGLPNPASRTLSGGTTITNVDNATGLAYPPTTSGDWNSAPSQVGQALDTLATSGIVKSQTANKVLASPNGSSGVPSFRSLVSADIPSLPYASNSLTSAHIFVGNGSNVAADVAVSGDLTLANTGAFTIASGAVSASKLGTVTDGVTLDQSGSGSTLEVKAGGISNTQVNASAAIALSKLAALTANKALQSDGSGVISASSVTSTELGYLSGVTGAIQTQLSGKATTALDNLSSVAINTSLLHSANNSNDLGSDAAETKDVWAYRIAHNDASTPNLTLQTTGNNGSIVQIAHGTGSLDQQVTKRRLSDSGASSNFLEEQYLDGLTLLDNQSAVNISSLQFAIASFEAIIVKYKIKESTANKVRVGELNIVTDGTSVSITDSYNETADSGVSWTAAVVSGNVEVRYTTTSTGNNRTMRALVQRIRA